MQVNFARKVRRRIHVIPKEVMPFKAGVIWPIEVFYFKRQMYTVNTPKYLRINKISEYHLPEFTNSSAISIHQSKHSLPSATRTGSQVRLKGVKKSNAIAVSGQNFV